MGNNCYKNKESDLRDQDSESNGTNKTGGKDTKKGGKELAKSTNG